MLEKELYLKTKNEELRVAFTFDVLEKIQEKFGTYQDWTEKLFKDFFDVKILKESLVLFLEAGAKKNGKSKKYTPEEVSEILSQLSFKDVDTILASLVKEFFGKNDNDNTPN